MTYLSDNIQKLLRENNIIAHNEVASEVGDVYVAINVIDQSRRVISFDKKLLKESSTKKILKG
jgi:hypothetical protein